MFRKTKICTAALLALGGGAVVFSLPAAAQDTATRVEVTGTRIKRVDAEGALPVTTYSREDLTTSGATTIAEFMRTLPFATAGNFRPQSGSSAPGYADIDLRGLGPERTLVLIDGRRAPKAAQVGSSADVNSIPMAAIERVEVLLDGASAIYGSDAIAGVVNFITRKNFQGIEASVGYTDPKNDGGEKSEVSVVAGMTGDKGYVTGGFSRTKRAMVFTSQRPWGQTLGATAYGNNQYVPSRAAEGYFPLYGPGGTCESIGPNFYTDGADNCAFNFNAVAADEQEIETQSVFLRGEYQFAPNWSAFVNASVSRVDSFGRYAPVPGIVVIPAGHPVNEFGEDIYLLHRFAAAGNRDDYSSTNTYDYAGGLRGTIGKVDVEFGARMTESNFKRLGYNYIVQSQAERAIVDGMVFDGERFFYDPRNPYDADPRVLKAISATISRDSHYNVKEVWTNATTPLFKMDGGDAALNVGFEFRKEDYQDQYDSLSEAGEVLGSSGGSAAGERNVRAVSGEINFPILKNLEANLSARWEDYSDYGNDFSPKASVKFKPIPELALRGSVGKGFRAPSLDILNAAPQFSAESVKDPATCAVLGCNPDGEIQRDTFFLANPELSSEKSTQFTLGAVWDATPNLNMSADYWHTKIEDKIGQVTAQEIVDRDNGVDDRPIPPGLGLTRTPTGAIREITAGYANEGELKVHGIDIAVNYNWTVPNNAGKLAHGFKWSHMFKYEEDGVDDTGEMGLPENRATLYNTWTMGEFEVSWNFNFIGKNGKDKRDEGGSDERVGSYTTNDLQLNWMPAAVKGAKFSVGALNLGDKMPELNTYDGRNFNFYLYDSYGRQLYVRYTQTF